MGVVANVQINVDSRGAQNKLRQLDSQANKTQRAFSGLAGAVGKLAAGFGAFQALRFSIVKAAELQKQTKSLEVLTGSLDKAKGVIKELQDFGAVTPFTSAELIETAKRLKAFGVDTQNLVDTTKRLGDVAGATGAELSGIATAYGQIQAKGKLQTEELLQLQERGVDIATVLKKEYNLTGEEFSKALQKGQVSAEAVEFALRKLTTTGGQYANGAIAQSTTLAGKFSTLQDNVGRFAATIGQILTPALNNVLDQVNSLIGAFNQLFEIGGIETKLRQAGELDDVFRQELWDQATRSADELLRIGKATKDTYGQLRLDIFQESLKGVAVNVGLIKPTIAKPGAVELPPLLGGNQTGKGKKRKGRKGRTPEEIALERQLELRKRLSIELKRQNALLGEADKFERSLLQIKFARQDIEAQIAQVTDPMKRSELQALADENSKMEEQNVLRQIMLDQVNSLEIAFDRERTQLEKYMDQLRKQLTDTKAIIIDLSQAIETSFASAMSSAVQDAVNGTRTVSQVFAQMFADIGNAFIDLATKLLAQQAVFGILSLFNFGGGGGTSFSQGVNSGLPQFGNYSGITNFGGFGGLRANGGAVSSGKSYVVGERGPELFVPRSSGTIVPNEKMGGGGVQVGSINIKVENTGDQLSPQAQKQLAGQVQSIVLSTLTNERRSGGML